MLRMLGCTRSYSLSTIPALPVVNTAEKRKSLSGDCMALADGGQESSLHEVVQELFP